MKNMRKYRLSVLLGLLCLVLAVPVWAQEQHDHDAALALQSLQQGRRLHEGGNPKGALRYYDRALQSGILRTDNQAIAYNNRANAYADLGRYEDAVVDYSKALDLLPGFAEAYYNRGIARYRLGEYLGAIDDFSKAIKLNPGYVSAYYNRSFPLEGLGRFDEALKDLKKALQMQPKRKAYQTRLKKLEQIIKEVSGG